MVLMLYALIYIRPGCKKIAGKITGMGGGRALKDCH